MFSPSRLSPSATSQQTHKTVGTSCSSQHSSSMPSAMPQYAKFPKTCFATNDSSLTLTLLQTNMIPLQFQIKPDTRGILQHWRCFRKKLTHFRKKATTHCYGMGSHAKFLNLLIRALQYISPNNALSLTNLGDASPDQHPCVLGLLTKKRCKKNPMSLGQTGGTSISIIAHYTLRTAVPPLT